MNNPAADVVYRKRYRTRDRSLGEKRLSLHRERRRVRFTYVKANSNFSVRVGVPRAVGSTAVYSRRSR